VIEKEEMTAEMKKLKKEKELEQLYNREERKLFLGGLSQDTVEKDLRTHFTQFGQIIDAHVMRDRESGKSRGFGFVTFACSFMADAAMEHQQGHVINGKKIEPKYATPDVPRYKMTLPEMERELDVECENKRSVFVGALKDSITEENLVTYFSGKKEFYSMVKLMESWGQSNNNESALCMFQHLAKSCERLNW
jgi:RNA recognition motif-containing protein